MSSAVEVQPITDEGYSKRSTMKTIISTRPIKKIQKPETVKMRSGLMEKFRNMFR